MGGRVWSWLLEFAPVREAVRAQVRSAVDLVMDSAEDGQARQRERHRAALSRTEGRVGELVTQVEELTAANAALRAKVVELEATAEREAAEVEQSAQGMVTDVFCCQSCWAFWFLSTSADRTTCVVRGPFGRPDGTCTVCTEPLVTLPSAKGVVFRKLAENRISRPAGADEPRSDTELANAELDAIADGLARLPKVVSRTVAWVATGLTGEPDRPATVLDEVAGRTTTPVPLDGIVAGLRSFVEVKATL